MKKCGLIVGTRRQKVEKRRQQVEQLYEQGKKTKEIATILKVSIDTISKDLREIEKSKSTIKTRRKKIEERREKVVQLYEQRKTQKEMASILKVPITTIGEDLRALRKQEKIISRRKKEVKNNLKQKKEETSNIQTNVAYNKDINKLCEKFYGQPKILKVFDRYMELCQKKFETGQLEKEELEAIKKVVSLTNKYEHVVFFIRLSVKYGNLKDAMFMINNNIYNEEYSKEQKEKISKMRTQVKIVEQKIIAIKTLKSGLGVKQATIDSGLPETEVVKLNRSLISKNNGTKEKSKEEK